MLSGFRRVRGSGDGWGAQKRGLLEALAVASWSQGVEGPGMPRTGHAEDQPLAPLSSPALPFCEGSRGSYAGAGSVRQSQRHSGRLWRAGPRAWDGGDVWVGGRA